jgi:hypothetical protein
VPRISGKNFHGLTSTLWLSHRNGPHRSLCFLATPTVYSLNWEPQDLVVGLKQVKVVITYQYPIFPSNTDTISIPHQSTRFFNSFPVLKNGSFFGLILTRSPVFGFLPVYPLYSFTKNEYNPRISTRYPLASVSAIALKKISTTVGGIIG